MEEFKGYDNWKLASPSERDDSRGWLDGFDLDKWTPERWYQEIQRADYTGNRERRLDLYEEIAMRNTGPNGLTARVLELDQ